MRNKGRVIINVIELVTFKSKRVTKKNVTTGSKGKFESMMS